MFDSDKFRNHLSWDQQQRFDEMPSDEKHDYMDGYYAGGHNFNEHNDYEQNGDYDGFFDNDFNGNDDRYGTHGDFDDGSHGDNPW